MQRFHFHARGGQPARVLIASLLVAASVVAGLRDAHAQAPNAVVEQAEQEEHRRIEAERAAIESRYAEQERECRQRFAVSSCVEDAKRTRRGALKPLRERQIAIDAARRKRASLERSDSIAKKAADDGARTDVQMSSRAGRRGASAPSASAAVEGPSRGVSGSSGASEPPTWHKGIQREPTPMKPITPRPLEPRVADEGANRTAYAKRQAEAAQHRREVEARNAEQLKTRKPASPLPMPARAPARPASHPVAASAPLR